MGRSDRLGLRPSPSEPDRFERCKERLLRYHTVDYEGYVNFTLSNSLGPRLTQLVEASTPELYRKVIEVDRLLAVAYTSRALKDLERLEAALDDLEQQEPI